MGLRGRSRQIETRDILKLAEQLHLLKEEKKLMEDKVKAINREIEDVDKELVEAMVESELQSLNMAGFTFYLSTRTFATAKAEGKIELYEWFKENGHEAMVQETVNAQTLAAWVREQLDEADELPEEIQPLLNVYEKTSVGIRKGK